jgi:hypothetical protein
MFVNYRACVLFIDRRVHFPRLAASFCIGPTMCPCTHMVLRALYTVQSTLYTLNCTLYTLLSTLYSLLSTLYSLLSTLYSLHSTLYTLHFTLYTRHSTLDTRHATLCTVHRSACIVHCTVHMCPGAVLWSGYALVSLRIRIQLLSQCGSGSRESN